MYVTSIVPAAGAGTSAWNRHADTASVARTSLGAPTALV